MYTKFICAVFVASLMVPSFAQAQVSDDLVQQLTAVQNYLQNLILSKNPQQVEALPHEKIRSTVHDGVSWIIAAQEDDGHFAYEYLPYEGQYLRGDNIVRQAGTLYSLGEITRRSSDDNAERNEAIEKAIGYFQTLSPEHEYEGVDVRCITKDSESNLCKLGATSLALTGILGYVERYPDKKDEYTDLIEGYIAFITTAKKEGAGFSDQYRVGIGFTETESSFSNGEALLALVRYYQYNPRPEIKILVDEVFAYLATKEYDTPLYLWIMAALKDMQQLWPNDAYTTYGEKFTVWRLDMLLRSKYSVKNYCASTEGLASAYSLLQNTSSEVVLKRLRSEIDFWNTKNNNLQVTTVYRLVFDEKQDPTLVSVDDMTQSKGGFLTGEDSLTQRIDFTQHCITAYVQTLVDIDGQSL